MCQIHVSLYTEMQTSDYVLNLAIAEKVYTNHTIL